MSEKQYPVYTVIIQLQTNKEAQPRRRESNVEAKSNNKLALEKQIPE